MSARALWRGILRIGDVRVAVKLYAAIEDRDLHFHLLHDQDLVRVKQRLVHPESGREVPLESARKGFEVEPDVFVLLDPQELAALAPSESRDIRVTRFVEPEELDHAWFVRPYWLGADEGEDDFRPLVAAVEAESLVGIARWVMRKKEYVGALLAEHGALALVTLRGKKETISPAELPAPSGRAPDEKERRLAERLLSALDGEFDPAAYRDEYRARVLELIELKRQGGQIETEEYESEPEAASLAAALEASLKKR